MCIKHNWQWNTNLAISHQGLRDNYVKENTLFSYKFSVFLLAPFLPCAENDFKIISAWLYLFIIYPASFRLFSWSFDFYLDFFLLLFICFWFFCRHLKFDKTVHVVLLEGVLLAYIIKSLGRSHRNLLNLAAVLHTLSTKTDLRKTSGKA